MPSVRKTIQNYGYLAGANFIYTGMKVDEKGEVKEELYNSALFYQYWK